MTTAVAAALARGLAVRAERFVTAVAEVTLVFVERAVAVMTRHSIPAIEFDISRSDRVGVQDSIDHGEEVVEPAFGQSRSNRRSAFAGTEPLVQHMRMRRAGRRGGRIGLEGANPVGGVGIDF